MGSKEPCANTTEVTLLPVEKDIHILEIRFPFLGQGKFSYPFVVF